MPRTEPRSTLDWLRFLSALPGVPGHEAPAADAIAKAFSIHADRVERDRAGNVRGWIEGSGPEPRPRALFAAHMDRIGFLVKSIEPGGFLRLTELGGFDASVERLVLDHHERLDGTGYPRGLSADDLDLETRILTVCDVYDALVSPRVYRPAWSVDQAIGLLH
jgi:hypothetical protein